MNEKRKRENCCLLIEEKKKQSLRVKAKITTKKVENC